MSAPVQRDDDNMNDARLYAPPWARERPLPAAGQPQNTSSPPVASVADPTGESPAPKGKGRMPKGVGGPNISWAPRVPPQETFTGDVAIQALRRRLALEPDVVPQPPIVMRREQPFPWIARLGFVCLAAGVAAFGITALSVTDFYPPMLNKGDRAAAVAGLFPNNQSKDGFDATPARLVVEGGRATTNEPVPLGVSLKDPSGGESVFLGGLENGTRLTAGTPLGSKGWRISAKNLGSVLAYAPLDYIGTMHAAINLHAANNAVIDTKVVRLEWVPKVEQAASAPKQEAPRTRRPQLAQEDIDRLLKRSQQLLQAGDIAPARLLLRRAALAGSGQAALVLGGTYDPDVLQELGVLGFAPDPAKAREWYQKAAELGANEATRRLDRLAQAQR